MDQEVIIPVLQMNLILRYGEWINYYGKFRKFSLMKIFRIFHHRLMAWTVNRYKRFKGSMRKAMRWIYEIARSQSNLFVHWQHGFQGA